MIQSPAVGFPAILRASETGQGNNLYAYADEDPISLVDPLGLICLPWLNDAWNWAQNHPYLAAAGVGVGVAVCVASGVCEAIGAGIASRFFISAAAEEVVAAEGATPFAMGLDSGLDSFAEARGATTWKDFADVNNWKPEVLDKLADPETMVHFNLDNVQVNEGIMRAAPV